MVPAMPTMKSELTAEQIEKIDADNAAVIKAQEEEAEKDAKRAAAREKRAAKRAAARAAAVGLPTRR